LVKNGQAHPVWQLIMLVIVLIQNFMFLKGAEAKNSMTPIFRARRKFSEEELIQTINF
jgi:hypothetical protein